MKLEELEEKAEITLQESRRLAEKLDRDIELFHSHRVNTVNQCLRTKLVQEIDDIASKTLKQVQEKETDIRMFPSLYSDKEVWIQATFTKTPDRTSFSCSATMMVKRYAEADATDMALKYPNVKYMTTQDFDKKVKDLKSMISEGKIDKVLALRTEEVLWSYFFGSGLPLT